MDAQTTAPEAKTWTYQTDELMLAPYTDTVPSDWPEETLARLYAKTKADNTLDWLFPGMRPMTLNKFIHYFHNMPIVLGMVKKQNPERWETVGYGWLFDFAGDAAGRRASCGFVAFREYWGSDAIRQIARMALKYWFTEFAIEVLFGAATINNHRAHRFHRELGWREIGVAPKWFPTPDGLQDALVSYMTKEQFLREAL